MDLFKIAGNGLETGLATGTGLELLLREIQTPVDKLLTAVVLLFCLIGEDRDLDGTNETYELTGYD